MLSTGEVLPFDYVAIATGTSYGDTLRAVGPEAATRQGRLGQLQVGELAHQVVPVCQVRSVGAGMQWTPVTWAAYLLAGGPGSA